MKRKTPLRVFAATILAGTLTMAAVAAPKAGGTVYTKRHSTPLYSEAKKSDVVATLGFGEALNVTEVSSSGMWLHVAAGGKNGWVFAALTVDERPRDEKTNAIGTLNASETMTSAAARPISAEATGYAERHGLVNAGKDVDWVEDEAHKVSVEIVDSYLKENKKGEYQE